MSFFFNRSNKCVAHTNSHNQHFDSNNSYVISLENMWVTMDFVTYETIVPYKVGVEE